MDENTTETNTQKRYEKYFESQKRANKKYRETHKDKFREISRKYYDAHKNDEEFMKRQREKSLKSYYKRKDLKVPREKPENVLFYIQGSNT